MQGHGNSPEGADQMSNAPWNEVDKEKVQVVVSVGVDLLVTVDADYTEKDLRDAAAIILGPLQVAWIEEV